MALDNSITNRINNIPCPATRAALQALFENLKTDLDALEAGLEAHVHTANDTATVTDVTLVTED